MEGQRCCSLANTNPTDTGGNGLGILWSLQVSSLSGRLLPWTCWWPQRLAPPEERGGLKTAFCLQGARKASWNGGGKRRVPHHSGGTISVVSSWLFLTCQLFFAYFFMLEEEVSLGKWDSPETYLEARVRASPLLCLLLTVCIAEGN